MFVRVKNVNKIFTQYHQSALTVTEDTQTGVSTLFPCTETQGLPFVLVLLNVREKCLTLHCNQEVFAQFSVDATNAISARCVALQKSYLEKGGT